MSDDTTTIAAGSGTAPDIEQLDRVVIRFAGDSGDGMQLAGTRFTDASAAFGNDLATLPNFPAEIRAPQGTLPGVSSFQVQIADWDIVTPGDRPDVLVAMNPAALKSNLADLRPGGMLIVNHEAFDERNLTKAGYDKNPLEDASLSEWEVYQVPMETLTKEAVKDSGVTGRAVLRSKNFLALGLVLWLFGRTTSVTEGWVTEKFGTRQPEVATANINALKAGYNFGITTEAFQRVYEVRPAKLAPGTYTNVNGNVSLAWGLVAASQLAKLPLFYGTYPITPASDLLHELSRHKNFGVKTFQAEDEIAAVGSTLGAAFAGHLSVTGTSGPGVALKSEAISLGIVAELPMIIVDVQRAGPSTGMPTKPEQSDLMMAVYGRHGEAPMPVIAVASAADAFDTAIEAARLALKYMTPVLLLSDGYIATGSEPWRLPDVDTLPDISTTFAKKPNVGERFMPYMRDPITMAREWAIPGTPGLEHRLGGIEKQEVSGNVSYDPSNHQLMTDTRAWKIANIANDIPDLEVDDPDDADLLILGWGSTYGAITGAVGNSRRRGLKIARAHLRHLNPFPNNMSTVLSSYDKVLIPELNTGHLTRMIRAEYLVPAVSYSKIEGAVFRVEEIENKIAEMMQS